MNRQRGFTLIEVIVVTAIFASVLMVSYMILVSTMQAEQKVKDLSIRGKIGESILMQIRRDLQGVVFEGLGPRVFKGVDGGAGETSEDVMHFYTTATVTRPVEEEYVWQDNEGCLGYASVGYVIRRGDAERGNTLFRRVKWALDPDRPFEGDSYTPIYDQVVGLSLSFLDRDEVWQDDWDSESRFPEEEEESVEPGAIAVVTDTADEEEPPPPLVVPLAVQVELWVYLTDEDGRKVDERNQPIIEHYTTVVPILTTESLVVEEAAEPDPTTSPSPSDSSP